MIRQSADNLRLVFTVNKRVNKTADDSAVTGHPWGTRCLRYLVTSSSSIAIIYGKITVQN